MHRFVGTVGTALVGLLAVACRAGNASPPARAIPGPTGQAAPGIATREEAPPPPVALVASVASVAPDRPSFPADWTLGGAAAPLVPPPRPSPSSREALAILRSPPRRPVAAEAVLRIADLPVIEVGPRVDWSKEPTAPPSIDEARDLVFDWFGAGGRDVALAAAGPSGVGASISVRGQRFGFFDLGIYSSFTIPGTVGGLVAGCGASGGTGYRAASWMSLTRTDGPAIRVEGADAWFDYHTCKAYVMRRIDVLAMPIAGGLAYAFRTRCERCAAPVEELHLILPEQGWSNDNAQHGFHTERGGAPLSHLYLVLGPGAAGSIVNRFSASVIDRWKTLGAPVARRGGAVLGVEVSHAAAELEPTALVYVMDAPPE